MYLSQALLLIGFIRGFLSLNHQTKQQQCRYLDNSDFLTCTGRARAEDVLRLRKMLRLHRTNGSTTPASNQCTAPPPCKKVYHLGRLKQTMSSHITIQVEKMLERCCGGCSKYNETMIRYSGKNDSAVMSDILDEFDITYPILGSRSLSGSQGFYFIPVFEPQSSFYITLKRSEKEMALDVIMSCVGMWPVVVIGTLLSIIAGIPLAQYTLYFIGNSVA